MNFFEIAVTATVTLVIAYLFLTKNSNTSEVIKAGAESWAKVITAFQGR